MTMRMTHEWKRLLGLGQIAGVLVCLATPVWAQSSSGSGSGDTPARDQGESPAATDSPVPASPGGRSEFDDSAIALDTDMPGGKNVSMADRRQARDIFRAANSLARRGYNATAVAKYREAVALWAHPAFYYNLSIVQMRLSQPTDSYASLQEVIRLGSGVLEAGRYEEAHIRIEQLGRELAHIFIVCDEPDAEVLLDGRLLFKAPGRHEGVLPPGNHHIEARKPGYLPATRSGVFSAGETVTESLVLRYETRERRMSQWIPWTVTGLGAALVAVAGVSHWQASQAFDEYDTRVIAAMCGKTGCPSADHPEFEHKSADRWRTVTTITSVAGGVAVLSGAMLLYRNRKRTVVHESMSSTENVRITPTLGPGELGASVAFHF